MSDILEKQASAGKVNAKGRLTREMIRNYRAPRIFDQAMGPEELPWFRLRDAMAMMRDPVVRIGLNIRDAFISAADVEFETKNPQLGDWLRQQWTRIWDKNWRKITQTRQWGYQGCEITWERNPINGLLCVDRVKDFAPFDTRPLVIGSEVVGMSVNSRDTSSVARPRIFAPQALWLTFDARWGRNFGTSILRGAYGPWWQKWMDNGSKKTIQLRMLKDAYSGILVRYPDTMETLTDGTQLATRDIARELAENMLSGAAITLPSTVDQNGNKEWDMERVPDAGDPSGIFQWEGNLNDEIWYAEGITPEVIKAAETGSGFSGRSVPLIVTLQMIASEFLGYMEAIDRQVLRPAAFLNFGKGADYDITPVDLVDTFTTKLGGSAVGGGAMGGGVVNGQVVPNEQLSGQPQKQIAPPQDNGQASGGEQPAEKQSIASLSDSQLQHIINYDLDPNRRAEADAEMNNRKGNAVDANA